MALVATLAEFKRHLNIPSSNTSNDTELTDVLTAASEIVEKIIGGPLAVTSFTQRYSTRDSVIVPNYRPLVSVTSITPDYGTALDSSTYTVDTGAGTVSSSYGTWGSGTLVYTAGLSSIPYRVKLAGLIIGKHLWETQRGAGRPGDADEYVPPAGYAIPRRAQELLEYDQIPGIA